MRHTSRGMAGRMHHIGWHFTNQIVASILKQNIKLAAITLKFGTSIEHFAKNFLHLDDLFGNADFAAAFLLDVRGSRQMVSMNMRFDKPFNR